MTEAWRQQNPHIDIYCYLLNMLHRICDSFVSTKVNKTKVVYMAVLCVMKNTISWVGEGGGGWQLWIPCQDSNGVSHGAHSFFKTKRDQFQVVCCLINDDTIFFITLTCYGLPPPTPNRCHGPALRLIWPQTLLLQNAPIYIQSFIAPGYLVSLHKYT